MAARTDRSREGCKLVTSMTVRTVQWYMCLRAWSQRVAFGLGVIRGQLTEVQEKEPGQEAVNSLMINEARTWQDREIECIIMLRLP